jgi:alkanesulfonate monooxygenase SsuD/methylene tetrahydromethanopterin reductase-like flavin-dependent oxidoreductase (luciferase family)
MPRAVQYGLSLPTGRECGDPRFLLALAEKAEEVGWDGLFLEDYVCYGGDVAAPTCNVWAVLAAIAARTRRIRLGTEVTPVTRRRPWNVAREAAAVDQLSGGRMILGVGLGDTGESINVDASFVRFGEERDPRARGEMLDEALEIIAGLWTGEPFSYRGRHFVVDDVTFRPPPLQRPRIPIWIGGGYPLGGPTARAARWDGSALYRVDGKELGVDDVSALRAAAGHKEYDIRIGLRRNDRSVRSPDELAALEAAGVTWLADYVPVGPPDEMIARIERGLTDLR